MRHLKLYRAISLIRREGSIRRAAEKLAISPSALNRAILGFEEEIKVAVFERVPGGVALTMAGELLVELMERHLHDFDQMQDMLGELQAGNRGTLRIAIGTDIAAGLVLDAIARFEADNPRVSTELVLHDDTEPLQQRAVELALLTNPKTDDALDVVYAQGVPIIGWVREGIDPAPSGLWDILDERVLLPPSNSGSYTAIAHRLRRQRLEAPVSSAIGAAQVWQRMADDGRACIFPACVPPPRDQRARLKRLDAPVGAVQVTVLRNNRVPLSRPAAALLQSIQTVFETAAETV